MSEWNWLSAFWGVCGGVSVTLLAVGYQRDLDTIQSMARAKGVEASQGRGRWVKKQTRNF